VSVAPFGLSHQAPPPPPGAAVGVFTPDQGLSVLVLEVVLVVLVLVLEVGEELGNRAELEGDEVEDLYVPVYTDHKCTAEKVPSSI